MSSLIRRPVPRWRRSAEYLRYALWMDTLGLDSEYDYDPVWKKCIEIGVAPTFHSSVQGYGLHSSLTNMVYNHIGHFGAAGEAVCKSLFLGGVIARFPRMRAAFLEGGVSWGCRLYADLIGHWKVRIPNALKNPDPGIFTAGCSPSWSVNSAAICPGASSTSNRRRWVAATGRRKSRRLRALRYRRSTRYPGPLCVPISFSVARPRTHSSPGPSIPGSTRWMRVCMRFSGLRHRPLGRARRGRHCRRGLRAGRCGVLS